MTAALEGGEWSAARPGRTLPPGKTLYPFYRRLGVPQGRSGRTENLVLTGIWSRAVQPVASRYTDWTTGPTYIVYCVHNIHFWSYLPQLFLEWEMFRTKAVQKIKTHILCSVTFFRKSCRLWDNVEKYCRAGQATDGNMAHARCMLDT